GGDLLARVLVDLAIADRRQIAPVEHREVELLGAFRRMERHRDVDEAEADRPRPSQSRAAARARIRGFAPRSSLRVAPASWAHVSTSLRPDRITGAAAAAHGAREKQL